MKYLLLYKKVFLYLYPHIECFLFQDLKEIPLKENINLTVIEILSVYC